MSLVHAVVLGAGLAGLCAARVLAEHGVHVTLLERDHVSTDGAAQQERPGTPQARHVHALLTRGRRELDALFPGLGQELVDAGGLELDWTTQRVRSIMGWVPRFDSGLLSVFCSRSLLEQRVRRRVLAMPGVTLLDGHEAVGLQGRRVRITGATVRARPRPAAPRSTVHGVRPRAGVPATGPAPAFTLDADLVVDATGRGSGVTTWLASMGTVLPAEEVVSSQLGYASRVFGIPAGFDEDWRLLVVRSAMPSTRAGVLYPIEGNRWFVTVTGQGEDVPPHDDAGFLAFARSLEGVAPVLDGATPLGRVATYRRTENRWRRWDRVREWPDGLIVLGDALCSFNPAYGQGMSVATMQARLLDDLLREAGGWRPGTCEVYQRQSARLLRNPWILATQEDFRYPHTNGRRSHALRLAHAYTDSVLRAAVHDRVVTQRFFEVAHLVRPTPALIEPSIVARVVRYG